MADTKQLLEWALLLSLLLNLWSSKLNHLLWLCVLVAVATASLAIYGAYRRFLRTAYAVFQAATSVAQWLRAFLNGELAKDAFRELKGQTKRAIAEVVKSAREICDIMIAPLARRAGHVIYNCFIYIQRLVTALFIELNILPTDTGDEFNEYPPKEYQNKAVILVTLPFGRSYTAMKEAIGSGEPELRLPFINWDSNNKGLLPALSSLKTSIRHFAVCLIPLDAWDDPTKSLLQKFARGTFWELIGPDMVVREGEQLCWKADQIRMIESVAEVGVVAYEDELVSEKFYRVLRAAWPVYHAVWWNSYDFAIRLAYILVRGPSKDKVLNIRQSVEILRAREFEAFQLRMRGESLNGRRLGFISGFNSGVAVARCLELGLPGVPIAVAGMVVGWVSSAAADPFSSQNRIEPSYIQFWRKLSLALEEKLLSLQGFTNEGPYAATTHTNPN